MFLDVLHLSEIGEILHRRSVSLPIKIDIVNAYLLMMFVVVFVVNLLDFE